MGDVLGNGFKYAVLFEGMLHYDTRALITNVDHRL